jgi:hypothetical protein
MQETGKSCEEYMSDLPTEIESCKVAVEYGYTVENIGGLCRQITAVVATIDDTHASSKPVSNWNFCPEDIETISDKRDQEDLCDMAGDDIKFDLALNDEDGSPGDTIYTFPLPGALP